jgi:GNAT superfamily N-acetyltransferase
LAGQVQIRSAEPSDTELLFEMIVALARYERAPELVVGSPDLLSEALFGPDRSAEAILAEIDGTPVGFALFYRTFSTWQCRPGIWLEDLFVPEEHRGAGVGFALLKELARITVSRGYTRLEWAALDWNEPALGFYERLDARRLDEWVMHRLDGDALAHLADASPPGA